jgi:hypothetical protein
MSVPRRLWKECSGLDSVFARRTAEGSDVIIMSVVTRVLEAQHCFARRTVAGSDVNILRVVTRVQLEQHCFAWHTVEGSDVNIPKVATSVRKDQRRFASYTGASNSGTLTTGAPARLIALLLRNVGGR